MRKLLCFAMLFAVSFAALDYMFRKHQVCTGRGPKCFAMWESQEYPLNIIDWDHEYDVHFLRTASAFDSPYFTWGIANAFMASLSLKMTCAWETYDFCQYQNINSLPRISPHSVIYNNLKNPDSFIDCDPNNEYRDYTQFALTFASHDLMTEFDWPVDDNRLTGFCNMTAYHELYTAPRVTSAYTFWTEGPLEFPAAPAVIRNSTYEEIKTNIEVYGLHYTSVLYDVYIANYAYGPHIYTPRATGEKKWAPVLIWGVWEDVDGTIYLGGFFVGRSMHIQFNLLWFPVNLTQYEYAIHYLPRTIPSYIR